MDRALEFWLRLAGAVLDEVGPYVDVVLIARRRGVPGPADGRPASATGG